MVQKLKRVTALLTAVTVAMSAAFVTLPSLSVSAEPVHEEDDGVIVGDFIVKGGTQDTDYSYSSDEALLTILTSTPLTISMDSDYNSARGYTTCIFIKRDIDANITLDGVEITSADSDGIGAITIENMSEGNVTITIADNTTNYLSGEDVPAIQKNCENIPEGKGILTIKGGEKGNGQLTAYSNGGNAAIGSECTSSTSNIIISNCEVTAKVSKSSSSGLSTGAVIGSGESGSASNITITNHARVYATNDGNGAGIGGGYCGEASNITIEDGSIVTAKSNGGEGIGAGSGGGNSNVIIKNSSVYGTVSSSVTNGSDPVYLIELPNENDEDVYIDDEPYLAVSHKELSSYITKLYAYIPRNAQSVTIGDKTIDIDFSTVDNKFYTRDFTISATGGGTLSDSAYSYENGVLTILSDTPITVSGSTVSNIIKVDADVNADITLDNVNIDVYRTRNNAAFLIPENSKGNVTVHLADGSENTLRSDEGYAGLQKNGAYSATLGMLTIDGSGTLTAEGGSCSAGIGGGNSGGNSSTYAAHTANITISGGKIIAEGDIYGAGIGGGLNGEGTHITINDNAVVIANGGFCAADIGGGAYAKGETIEIGYGAVVTATGSSSSSSHGIGGGSGKKGSGITINGGSVKAVLNITDTPTKGTDPVYLLKIMNLMGEDVYIDDTLYAPANHNAADSTDFTLYAWLTGATHKVKVGANGVEKTYTFDGTAFVYETTNNDLKITADNGDALTAEDYTYTDGVLTVLTDKAVTISGESYTDRVEINSPDGANITLDNLLIDMSAKSEAAIKIIDGDTIIKLKDGTVNSLTGGNQHAGLQKEIVDNSSLEITGSGTLYARGGAEGAGIGGGSNGKGRKITISGNAVVYAYGGNKGAGIGGGYQNDCENIYIKGNAVVTAQGGPSGYNSGVGGAGIGGGAAYYDGSTKTGGNGTYIDILDNAVVNATGGFQGAGIGGGAYGNCRNVEIGDNAVVTAQGFYGGTGIGGGASSYSTCEDIRITGGSVKATGSVYNDGFASPAIGGCNNYHYGTEVDPTNDSYNEKLYLLEVDTSGASTVTINNKTYPTTHGTEDKIYVYLPAGTAAYPNKISIDDTEKFLFRSTKTKSWTEPIYINAPAEDMTKYVYNGAQQEYIIAQNDNYTIEGAKQTDAGTYKVTLTLNEDAVWNESPKTSEPKNYYFTIEQAKPIITLSATPNSDIKAGDTITVAASVNIANAAVNPVADLPNVKLYYKVAGGTETAITGGSFVIPNEAATSKTITIYARTDEADNYLAAEETTSIVTTCTHPNDAEEWNKDSTHHWHICPDCGNTVDKAEHISSGEPTLTTADVCTECGYEIRPRLGAVKAPVIAPQGGLFDQSQMVTITCENGATIYYTTDGTDPTTASTVYTGEFEITATTTVKAIAVKAGMIDSSIVSATFSLMETVAQPVINPNGGEFTGSQNVTITCATEGAAIYYTTDGTDPTTASTVYTGEFEITATTTIKAIAVKRNMKDSATATAAFTMKTDNSSSDGSGGSSGGSGGNSGGSSGGSSGSSGGSGGSSGGSGGGYSGSSSSGDSTTTNPVINGVSKTWNDITTDIANLSGGSEVTININGDNTIPANVVKTIADKNIKAEFEIDSWRSWIVDGAKIDNAEELKLSAIQVPSLDSSSLDGTVGAKLRIEASSAVSLQLSFKKDYAGKFANIYRLNSGKPELVDVVKVDENGIAVLTPNVNGDYIVMLSDYSDRKGDITNDGIVDISDASMLLKAVFGLVNAPNTKKMDFNEDGKVDILDASDLLKSIFQ